MIFSLDEWLLADRLNEPGQASVREGIFTCQNHFSTPLFVDLKKTGKDDRFHFNDYFQLGNLRKTSIYLQITLLTDGEFGFFSNLSLMLNNISFIDYKKIK